MTYSLPVIEEAVRSEEGDQFCNFVRAVRSAKRNAAQRIHQTLTVGSRVGSRFGRYSLDQSFGCLSFSESSRNSIHPDAVGPTLFERPLP
jgi:hypothetical protein